MELEIEGLELWEWWCDVLIVEEDMTSNADDLGDDFGKFGAVPSHSSSKARKGS